MTLGNGASQDMLENGRPSWGRSSMSPCKRCQGEVVQKNRVRLSFVGIGMIATLGLSFFTWQFLIPAVFLAMIGAYLLVWAIIGQGRWCRGCKRFDGV